MKKHKLLTIKRALWLSALVLLSIALLINGASYITALALAAIAAALFLAVFVVQHIAVKQDQASHFFASENLLNELDRITANGKKP